MAPCVAPVATPPPNLANALSAPAPNDFPPVANATAAAKLRQLAPELVVLMQNKGCEVSGIRVKVQVSFDRLQRKSAPHKLSKAAQNALNELSLNLNDSPLKVALERMAKIKS